MPFPFTEWTYWFVRPQRHRPHTASLRVAVLSAPLAERRNREEGNRKRAEKAKHSPQSFLSFTRVWNRNHRLQGPVHASQPVSQQHQSTGPSHTPKLRKLKVTDPHQQFSIITFTIANTRYGNRLEEGVCVCVSECLSLEMSNYVRENSPAEWPRFVASWSLSPCSLSPWPLSLELTMSASWNAELGEVLSEQESSDSHVR